MSPILVIGLIIAIAITIGAIILFKAKKTIASTLPEPEFKARPAGYTSSRKSRTYTGKESYEESSTYTGKES